MLRKKGILLLVILLVIIGGIWFLLTDALLERSLERLGSELAGAKVEIDNLDISLTGVYLQWDRLQVADAKHPMRNLIETGTCRLDLEFWPLLSRKVIIESVSAQSLQTNTPRTTDGSLPKPAEEMAGSSKTGKASKKSQKPSTTLFADLSRKINVDSVLAGMIPSSIKKSDSLYQTLNSTYQKWNSRLDEENPLPQLEVIANDVQAIDLKKLKDVKKLTGALKTVDKSQKELKEITRQVKQISSDLRADIKDGKSALGEVDKWIAQDIQKTRAELQLPDLSTTGIASMLFGSQLTGRITQYLDYLKKARYYAHKYGKTKPEKEKPPRLKGQDIYFPVKSARPGFWLRELDLNGVTADSLKLAGRLTDWSSEPKITARPTIFRVGGKTNGRAFELNGTLDYTGESNLESIEMSYRGMSLRGRKLANSSLLPEKLTAGMANIDSRIQIKDERLDGSVKFTAYNLKFPAQPSGSSRAERLIGETIRSASQVNLTAVLSGSPAAPKIGLKSNLDRLLSQALQKSLGAEIDKATAAIEAKIRAKTSASRKKLEKLISENSSALQNKLAVYENSLNKQQAALVKKQKDLEKKIAKEKSKLGDKAKKKLKGLF